MGKKSGKNGPDPGEGGRPRIEWDDSDWSKFDMMCRVGVDREDIAQAFQCSDETISALVRRKHDKTFLVYKTELLGEGRAKVLAKQMEVAMGGDRRMLIWLGKNLCGQSDRKTIDQTINVTDTKQDSLRKGLENPEVRAAMNTISDHVGLNLDDVDLDKVH